MHKPPDASRFPILMSAVVYPGVGQFMQRRPVAGTLQALAFTIATVVVIVAFVLAFGKVIWTFLSTGAWSYEGGGRIVLAPLAAWFALYLWSVIDAWWFRSRLVAASRPPPLP